MKGYLGTQQCDISTLEEYRDHTKEDWVMHWVMYYGQYDGGHHKQWTLDQIARILKGTEVIVKEASWDCGHTEHRFSLGEPTQEYLDWVVEMKDGEDGADTYSYDEGCAP